MARRRFLPRRTRLPPLWQRHGRRRRVAGMRMMIWAGLLLGLTGFHASRWLPGAAPTPSSQQDPPRAVDPYREAHRSHAILVAQEGAPPSLRFAPVGAARTSALADPGAVRVIDGDTFDYAGVRIRVADIDTPETHGRCPYETDLAARASRRMGALLAAGPFGFAPTPDGRDQDRYGRKLRIVVRHGRSLGDVLVAEGLARRWTGHREPWCV